jgi:hypothetical protein
MPPARRHLWFLPKIRPQRIAGIGTGKVVSLNLVPLHFLFLSSVRQQKVHLKKMCNYVPERAAALRHHGTPSSQRRLAGFAVSHEFSTS